MPITPTYAIIAASCPAPPAPGFLSISGAGTATGGNQSVFENVTPGLSAGLSALLRRNATRDAILAAFGGGGVAICTGLALSAGTGLNISVAAGTAMIGGPVNLESAGTLGVPNNASCWVYLASNGVLSYSLTLTPPANACLLGQITAASGVVTAIDFSGAVFLRGGVLWRQTGDFAAPTDSPPASLCLLTRTAGGLYLWDGVSYQRVGSGAMNVQTLSATATIPAVSDVVRGNANSAAITLTLPSAAAVNGRMLIVKNVGSANNVTVQAGGSDTVAGGSVVLTPGQAVRLLPTGGVWESY